MLHFLIVSINEKDAIDEIMPKTTFSSLLMILPS